MYLRRNDYVVVTAGVDRGKQGHILRVDREREMVVVQGINLRYKHIRRSQKNPKGGRIQKEAPIPVSKVQLVDRDLNRPTRVGFRIENGRKVRFSKRTGKAL